MSSTPLEIVRAELEAIRARHEAAAGGEWLVGRKNGRGGYYIYVADPADVITGWGRSLSKVDSQFIVSAHNTDIPRLLSALETALIDLNAIATEPEYRTMPGLASYFAALTLVAIECKMAAIAGGHEGEGNDNE